MGEQMERDESIVFPLCIFEDQKLNSYSEPVDIVVMRKAPGVTLRQYFGGLVQSWNASSCKEIASAITQFAIFLARFRFKYGVHHNDMHMKNVLLQKNIDGSMAFSIIDNDGSNANMQKHPRYGMDDASRFALDFAETFSKMQALDNLLELFHDTYEKALEALEKHDSMAMAKFV